MPDQDHGRVHGLHFAKSGDRWDFWSYPALARLTLRTAAALHARGVRRGDVVAVIQRSSPGFVAGLFGSFAAGATACSIAPPFAFQRADEYERHISHMLSAARPAAIVVDGSSITYVRQVARQLGLNQPLLFDELIASVRPLTEPLPPAELALLQFTSGSSGHSRGVRIPTRALGANVAAMRHWLGWTPDHSGITWLPVHHDMGLIGCLINAVTTGCDAWIMQPEDYIRAPLRYLTCISEQRIQMTAMPNFGLAYLLRRIQPEHLRGLRFDSLRAVILGSERIDPYVLERVEDLLGPFGFDRAALLPAYGGAEATLAVTGLPMDEGWTAVPGPRVDPTATGAKARIMGCGRPLDGVTVSVVDEDGRPVPDGAVGEIQVTGVSVAAGYVGNPGTASGTSLDAGTLRTGDGGFLKDGQLFVLGRLGDGLKVRGRMVFAESIEARLHERGLPERRVAVLLGVRDGVPTAAVVFETPRPQWPAIAAEVLRESLEDTLLLSVTVPRGGLNVTTSGKPRRRVMWQALCDATLVGQIGPLVDGRAPVAKPVTAGT